MGGGGVKQTTLYTWDGVTVSTNSTPTIFYLTEDADKFDYLMVTVSANDTKRLSTIVIDCHSIDWSNFAQYHVDFGDTNTTDFYAVPFYVNLDNNKKKCQFFTYIKGTDYTSTHIQSVVGIKYIDPDIKNVTSLDETLLYSGNDQITATTGSTAYTLSDDIINFDYILVTIYGINSGTTQSVNVLAKVPVSDSYGFDFNTQGHLSYINSYGGWFVLSNNQIEFALRYKGENVSSVVLSSVVGIKLNTLSTADIAEMAMPSDVSVNIPIGTSGDTYNSYTITANGYVNFGGSFANGVPILRVDHSNGSSFWVCLSSNNWDAVFIPVKKGDIVKWRYSSGSSSVSLTFFYSIGDAKALGLI